MLEFFTEIGEGCMAVWVSGTWEYGHFVADTVYPRNAASVNILDALSQAQFDQIAAAAEKANDDAYAQHREDVAADLYADRMAA